MFFVVLLAAIPINAQQAVLQSEKITFVFPAKEVEGSIRGFQSSSKVDWNNPENSVFQGSVEVETLDTNNGLRNWSLRSSRYFHVKKHPKMTFKSRTIENFGENWTVTGDLTIKGTTKEFKIVFAKKGKSLKGRGELYCSDFGIKIKKLREDNLVIVDFEFELVP